MVVEEASRGIVRVQLDHELDTLLLQGRPRRGETLGNVRLWCVLEEAGPQVGARLAGEGVGGAEPPANRREVETARRGDIPGVQRDTLDESP